MITLLAILTVVAVIISYISLNKYDIELLGIASATITVFAGLALVICSIVSICIHSSADATTAEYNAERQSLIYQLENNLYDNDNDLGKKELYDQITTYNKDIVSGRELHNKFLTACFYPDIYDDLELIEFDEVDS